ncbi:MAG: hypothetical protein EOM59_02765 [Clostridia bacterium]|nr:hypothetical protein [Clostridia bacterium]
MEYKRIILMHRDSQYAGELAGALAFYLKSSFMAVVTPNSNQELLDTDYLMTDNSTLAESYKEKGIYLYDDVETVSYPGFSIHRFQSVRAIAAQLLEYLGQSTFIGHISGKNADQAKFIGITSGSGGTGTSSLAVCMGRILSRLYGKSVLYISFEAFKPAHYAFSFNCCRASIDKLLYGLAGKAQNYMESLDDYVFEDAFELKYIAHKSNLNPLLNTEERDIYNLLYYFATVEALEIIILDVPCSFLHYASVMRMCERKVINFGFNPQCFIPSENLKNDLQELFDFASQDEKERVFEFKPLKDDDSFICLESGFDIDIHGQFGAEVRGLVDRLEIR